MDPSINDTHIVCGLSENSAAAEPDSSRGASGPIECSAGLSWRAQFEQMIQRIEPAAEAAEGISRGEFSPESDSANVPDGGEDPLRLNSVERDLHAYFKQLREMVANFERRLNEEQTARSEMRLDIERLRLLLADEAKQKRELSHRLEIAQHHLEVVGAERDKLEDRVDDLQTAYMREREHRLTHEPQHEQEVQRLRQLAERLEQGLNEARRTQQQQDRALQMAKQELEQIRAQRNVIRNELESLQRISKQDRLVFERRLAAVQLEKEQLQRQVASPQNAVTPIAQNRDDSAMSPNELDSLRMKLQLAETNFAEQSKILELANDRLQQLYRQRDQLQQENLALSVGPLDDGDQEVVLVEDHADRPRSKGVRPVRLDPATGPSASVERRAVAAANTNGPSDPASATETVSDLRQVFTRMRSAAGNSGQRAAVS